MPVSSTKCRSAPLALMPMTSARFDDQAVVRAEHGRPERAGQPHPPAGREAADDLTVDPLVGRHLRGGVVVVGVRASGPRRAA